MSDQELARALMSKGLLTAPQIQMALSRREPGRSFAQTMVDLKIVSPIDVAEIDPHAFGRVQTGTNAQNGNTQNGNASKDEARVAAQIADISIGLGQDDAPDSGDLRLNVRIHGESERQEDGTIPSPIRKFCNELIAFAVQLRASDLHLEPRSDGLLPRYRVDGHLRTYGENPVLPAELQAPIVSRFKVLSNLDITETRLPQDGRFRATVGERVFDFRVSSLPGILGEKLVLRLLDRSSLVTDLTKLGFSDEERNRFEEMLGRSYGLVLVTGPTGSGKTTTLYAALAATRDETKNVITVEDPVEYEMSGVTQTSIHSDIGLTFATQLRAILRQDPDVILVGEIRDNETADIAVRAALTGHLVLSTLHTNSAAGAVARLQDMQVPDFLLASSLTGVLAQRLVRLICRHCREPIPQNDPQYEIDIARLRLKPGATVFRGAGCEHCNETGMRGRMALLELMNVDGPMRRALAEAAPLDTLRELAKASGMKSLWQDGVEKVQRGLTTAEEVSRALLGAEDIEAVMEEVE